MLRPTRALSGVEGGTTHSATSRRFSALVLLVAASFTLVACERDEQVPSTLQKADIVDEATSGTSADSLAALYSANFALASLSADLIADIPKPDRASGSGSGLVGPACGPRICRITSADAHSDRMRHGYSHRKPSMPTTRATSH